MFPIAFSTVACPDLGLDRVVALALELGFDGVELRTLGFGPSDFVADPALTDAGKVRRTLARAGIAPAGIATSLCLDDPIRPRVIGRVIGDQERSVRQAKRLVDLAAEIECPRIRVFTGRRWDGESQRSALRRIAERAFQIADHAEKTGVTVLLENIGDFATAAALLEVVEAVGHPRLAACYCASVGWAAGDRPVAGVGVLGDRLALARVKDLRGGRPALPGRGEVGCEAFVRATPPGVWRVFEWDRAWFPDLDGADVALQAAAEFFRTCADSDQARLPVAG